MKKIKTWLFPTGIFLVILILGLFLRIRQMLATDFWFDEAFTGVIIRFPWEEMFDVIAHDKVHPPLFYALLKSWTLVVGSTSALAIRSFSLIFGFLSVPLAYLITQQLVLKEKAKQIFGLITMFVFAVSPFFVAYSVEARSYSFILFLSLVSLLFFIRAMKTPYRLSWSALLCCAVLYVISKTHFLSILIGTGYVVAYFLLFLEDKQWLYNKKVQIFGGIGALIAWMAGTWFWNAFDLRKHVDKDNLPWIPVSDLSQMPHALYAFLFGVDPQANGLPPVNGFLFPFNPMSFAMVLLIAVVILLVVVLQKIAKNKDQFRDLLLFLSVGIVPLAVDLIGSSLQLNIYVDRYVIGAGAFLILLVLYILWQVGENKSIYVICGYAFLLCLLKYPTPMVRYTTALAALPQNAENTGIIIGGPLDYLVFKYYLPDTQLRLIANPAGYPYNWSKMMPASIEVAKNDISKGNVILVHKSDGQNIPASWKKVSESKEFIVWQKQ